MTITDAQITAAARALSNDNADTCNVNREDNWMIYGDSFRETARVALEAAFNVSAPAVDGARDMDQARAMWAIRNKDREIGEEGVHQHLRDAFDDGFRAALSVKGEPVAWFDDRVDADGLRWGAKKPSFSGDWKPLYRSPQPKLPTESVDKAVHKLSDEQITDVWNSMPGGYDGFLKSWGYIQFARALLTASDSQGGAA